MKKAPLVVIMATVLSVSSAPAMAQAHAADTSRISNTASGSIYVLAADAADADDEEAAEGTSSGMTVVSQVWNYALGIVALGSMLAILGQAVHLSGALDSLLSRFR